MKQVAIVSGKGGTGKTSLTAAFAALAQPVITVDGDVDAADLHLILRPEIKAAHELEGGLEAWIDPNQCVECHRCVELCRFDAIDESFRVDRFACEGCGVCADHCAWGAVHLHRHKAGDWFESETRFGPLLHARLGIAQENSGRLVAQVRNRARDLAKVRRMPLILIDGPPGIGCPVISSITGVDLAVVVSEPTPSGLHDLDRVLKLAAGFRGARAVCVNKADLDPEQAERIAARAVEQGAAWLGGIPFDPAVTGAMIAGLSLPEYGDSPAAAAIAAIWANVQAILDRDDLG